MANQAEALSYAARLPVLVKYFAHLILVMAALTLFPFAVSVFTGEMAIAFRYVVVIFGLSLLGWLLTKRGTHQEVQVNEGLVIVASVFLAGPLVMTYPLMGSDLTFTDALFEAVSGITTTGLSTLKTVEDKPAAFLFARAWMQWYGGLGIVVFSLALLLRPGMAAKRLSGAQAKEEDLVGGTKAHARRVLKVYALLTGCGILLLLLTGAGFLDAVVYTLASVSTGGFSPHDASLSGLGGPFSQSAVIAVCLACAVPLTFYHTIYRKSRRPDGLQAKSVVIAGLAATVFLALCLRSVQGCSWSEVLQVAPIMAFSAQTTAGFSNTDVSQLHDASKLVLILAMAVGGGAGSTAGGFKVLRLLTIVSLLKVTVKKTAVARHAVLFPRIHGLKLEEREVHEGVLIVILFIAVIVLSWFSFVIMGYDSLDSLFEVVSATGTVGLSAGLTGPDLPAVLKGVLCADMLLGRLEILAWLVVVYPGTWLGRRL